MKKNLPWLIVAVLTAVSLFLEYLDWGHSDHWYAKIPAFWIIFGFAGCLLIILLYKIGSKILQKGVNYYDHN